ncbi:MAG: bifunctional nuclease family protein [Propionicimonas sp.]
MRELTVSEVRVSTSGTTPVVVLREVDGDRLLPIWMSAGGAAAIVAATEEPDPARPAIHDLVGELLTSLGGGLDEARIVGYEDGQFYAEVVVDGTELACRPSDAIALALRVGRPIRCTEDVLDAGRGDRGRGGGRGAGGGSGEVPRVPGQREPGRLLAANAP